MKNSVGILGPYSFGNLGNAALQRALVYQIQRNFRDSEIYGCCINPAGSELEDGVRSFPLNRHVPWNRNTSSLISNQTKECVESPHRPSAWLKRITLFGGIRTRVHAIRLKAEEARQECVFLIRALKFAKQFRILIVGLGGVLDDLWGGPWHDPYSLFKWAIIAKLTKTPFVFMSVGAEAIETRTGKFFLKTALRLATYRSYRDEESKLKAEGLGVPGPNYVFPDLAFSLQPVIGSMTVPRGMSPKIVAVSPMAYCDPRVWPIKNADIYHAYLRTLCSFVVWLLEQNYEVRLVATQFRMDEASVQELKEMVLEQSSQLAGKLLVPVITETIDGFLTLASQVRFVVTSRLHGAILPFLVNTPVLAISHENKIDRLMAGFDLSQYCINIEKAELSLLSQRAIAIEANHTSIRKQIEATVTEYRNALTRQFTTVFSPLVSPSDRSVSSGQVTSSSASSRS